MNKIKIISLVLYLLTSLPIKAQDVSKQNHPIQLQNNPLNYIGWYTALGILNVKAQSYVFYNNFLVSHLIWNTKTIPLIKTGFNYHLTPRLTLNTLFWVAYPKENSHLDDYDWMYRENPYYRTNWSSHDKIKLKANGWDINLKYWLPSRHSPARFSLILGLLYNRYQWVAFDSGYYEYEPQNFYGYHGDSQSKGLSYQQTFKIPYIGIGTGFTYRKLNLDATYKISRTGTVRDLDLHHLRGLKFRGYPIERPIFIDFDLHLGYQYNPHIQFYANTQLSFTPRTKYQLIVERIDKKREPLYLDDQRSDLRNISKSLVFGMKYSFQ